MQLIPSVATCRSWLVRFALALIAWGTAGAFAGDLTSVDLGNPAVAGTTSVGAGGIELAAAGVDIGGNSDQGRFAYEKLTGDFDVRVRVLDLANVDPYAKAGLMVRDTLGAGSPMVAVVATPGLGGCFVVSRTTADAGTLLNGSFPANHPFTWLRLRREGNAVSGFGGWDGLHWRLLHRVERPAPAELHVGLVATSHIPDRPVTARFSDYGTSPDPVLGELERVTEGPGPSSRRTALTFSEIHYHPAARADGADLEFIEIFNSNPFAEELGGFRITGDVDFTFPEGALVSGGGYVVVAKSPAAFAAATGLSGVLGPFTGNLPNDQGNLRLRNRTGAILLELNYRKQAPWPESAGGSGHSLVLVRPSLGEANPGAWGASRRKGGSPGAGEVESTDPWDNVLLNEIFTNPVDPADEFIELYNRGSLPVDISGCWLSDNPATNKFAVPAATILLPGGTVAFRREALGFGVHAAGDLVLLSTPDQSRVMDAIRMPGQSLGISSGRSPNGSPGWRRLQSPSPGAPNPGPRVEAVAINELMYHPLSGLDDDEYVELHNAGEQPVPVGGWKLVDGIEFMIPEGRIIPGGGFLVIARNAARLLTNYAGLAAANTVGDFNGTLSDAGDRVALVRPETMVRIADGGLVTNRIEVIVDEVTYGTGGRWPSLADGGGSSLELVNPASDHRRASNWADSDETQRAPWTEIEQTGPIELRDEAVTPDMIQVLSSDPGEFLLDDLEVTPEGSTNRVTNPGFEAGVTGWKFQGGLDSTGLESGEGYQSAKSLHVRAATRGDTVANRIFFTFKRATPTSGLLTVRAKARWLSGAPNFLFRLHGNGFEAPVDLTVPPDLGTPGRTNSRYLASVGPAIVEVSHFPVLPAADVPVLVTARVTDPDGVASVRLRARPDPGLAASELTMHDDGLEGDRVAGDGIYTVEIPGRSSGGVVAFRIEATDASSEGTATLFPGRPASREALIRWGETRVPGGFGTYRVWMTKVAASTLDSRLRMHNTPVDCTFVYGDERVIHGAGVRYTGSVTAASVFSVPKDYALTMPADATLLGQDEFTIQFPGNVNFDDPTTQREQTAYWIGEQLGLPACHRRNVVFVINGTRRNGNSIMEDTQQPDTEMVRQWFPDAADGELFKISHRYETGPDGLTSDPEFKGATLERYVGADGKYKTSKYRWTWQKRGLKTPPDDYSTLHDLLDAVNTGGADNYDTLADLIDFEQWMRTFAAEHVFGNWDSWGFGLPDRPEGGSAQNMFAYKPRNGRWKLIMWDVDQSLGDDTVSGSSVAPTTSIFSVNEAKDSVIGIFYRHPPFRRALVQGYYDALSGPMVATNYNPILDRKYAALIAAGFKPNTPKTIKTYLSARATSIRNQLRAIDAPLRITSGTLGQLTTDSTPVTLAGSAPLNARRLLFNGREWPIRWNTATNWQIALPLELPTTPVEVQAIGPDGKVLALGTAKITINFTGAPDPLPPVRFNEWMASNTRTIADPADGKFEDWFELYNSGDAPADLSGYRLKDSTPDSPGFLVPGGFVVPAGGYRLVWADTDVDQNGEGRDLHVDFKLSAVGDSLSLIAPDGRIVDSIGFTNQVSDVSEGRTGSSPGAPIVTQTNPTPGAANPGGEPPVAPELLALQVEESGLVRVRWASQPGVKYRLEAAEDLVIGGWMRVGEEVVGSGPEASAVELGTGNGPARFYRVVVTSSP